LRPVAATGKGEVMGLAVIILLVAVAVLSYLLWRLTQQLQTYRERYSGLIDTDKELASIRKRIEAARDEEQKIARENDSQKEKLGREYDQALATYKRLQQEVSVLEENLEDISFGLYKPHFTFESPEEYKARLTATREHERQLIRSNQAAVCPVNWTVGDSKREGQRMVRLNSQLLLSRRLRRLVRELRKTRLDIRAVAEGS
jgi:chromosome segregation ATPase